MPRLIIEDGPEKGTTYDLGEVNRAVIVGRSNKCDVVLSDALMSRQHFRLEKTADAFTVTDMDSHNGTHVNGVLLAEETVLKSGDRIRSGKTIVAVRMKGVAEAGRFAGKKIGDYLLHERIGTGGMGEIYKATQVSLGRTVALKILSDELGDDKSFIEKFLSEARAAGRLNHPNVVQVHEVGQDKGTYYFSMEFLAGGSVQDLIRGGEKFDPKRAVEIVIGAAKALEYAEKQGVVHCDIKPDNLMLTEDGDVRLADLGIARRVREGRKIVQDDGVYGSPHYMAPEQAKGQPIDNRVDIYALGCSFYRMLAGRTPFSGDDARQIMEKQVYEVPTSLREAVPDLPRSAVHAVEKMMTKNPRDRYQTATDLLVDLEKAKTDLEAGKTGQAASQHTRTAPRVAPRKRSATGSGALVLVAVGAVAAMVIAAVSIGGGKDTGLEYYERAGRLANDGEYEQAIETLEKARRLTGDGELLAKIKAELNRLTVVRRQAELERAAQDEVSAVDRFVAENRDSHLEARNRYRAIAQRYRALAISHLAEKKAKDHDAEHEALAERTYQQAKSASDEVLATGRYGRALEIWKDYPKIYDGTAAAQKAAGEPDLVTTRADADYKAALAKANDLVARREYSKALSALDRFAFEVDLEEYRTRAAKDKGALRAKIDKAKQALAKLDRAAKSKLASTLMRESWAVRRCYDFTGARQLLRRAESMFLELGQKEDAEEIPPIIEQMNRQEILFDSLVEQTRKVEVADNTVRFADGRSGRAISATAQTIRVAVTGGKNESIPWGALSNTEMLNLMRGCNLPPEQVFSLGLFCIEHGLGSRAVEEFMRAGRMRRAFKAEAAPHIELAQMLGDNAPKMILKEDGKAWLKRIDRLITDGDHEAARTGLAILRARYVPKGAVGAADVDALAKRLPAKRAEATGRTRRTRPAGRTGSTGPAGVRAATVARKAEERKTKVVDRIDKAVRRVVARKIEAPQKIYRERGEHVTCGDMMLAAGKPAEARGFYERELREPRSYWTTSGAGRLRIARTRLLDADADSRRAVAETAAAVSASAARGGPVKAEADALAKLVAELPELERRTARLESDGSRGRDGAAFGELAELLAERLPGSLESRVAAERLRLGFAEDERVTDGRVTLWILRHRWAARDLDKVWDDVAKLRRDHAATAKAHAAELDLIAAEGLFNAGRWMEAKARFESCRSAAPAGGAGAGAAGLVADGTVGRRIKRCNLEISALGTGN